MVTTERTGAASPVDGWVRAGELEELAATGVRAGRAVRGPARGWPRAEPLARAREVGARADDGGRSRGPGRADQRRWRWRGPANPRGRGTVRGAAAGGRLGTGPDDPDRDGKRP